LSGRLCLQKAMPELTLMVMHLFELRGRQIFVESGQLYESSSWDAAPLGEEISDEVLVVRGVIYTTREKSIRVQKPFAYVDEETDSALGLWLDETVYRPVAEE